ncbi:MAG TPA: DUF4105 domain-containing protein [Burkholderiales bacterium]|nr:DUF4105 domain-containing protein [Burkholderiales bacterium]
MGPGVHSLADSPRFFLAADGKTNPQSELEATLASFFSDVEETQDVQNPQCAFIARYTWLDRQLGFDSRRMRKQTCKRFDAWRDALNPQGVTLIFPAAYLNNPSSMFGHTLLRIDAKDQDEKTRLLAYTINFAANTNETSGVVFAIKGLTGVYPGRFSISPYYLKVREYNDLENRDIWEYQLNLTPEQINMLLMHAWELGPINFNYYFFNENCSYYLLELLEVARPDLDLTRGFRWWAIPSDTVRAVVKQKGLLKSAVFRPSNATIISYRLGLMNPDQRTLVKEMSGGLISTIDPGFVALPGADQAGILEVSYDYLDYLRITGHSPVQKPGELANTLLLERSRLGVETNEPAVPVPEVRPDQGHGTSRVALGAGSHAGADFVELSGRVAYHDLMDPEGGYVRGAQIDFLDFAVRDYGNGIGTRLENLTIVDILSITPRNEFFRPLSWNIDVGWARRRIKGGSEPLVFGVHGGPGLAWTVPDSLRGNTTVYAFLDSTAQINGNLEDGYALGIGPNVGVLTDFTSRWRANLYISSQRFFTGDTDTAWSAGLRQRYTLSTNWALKLDLSHDYQEKQSWNTVLLSLDHYF